MSTPVVIRTALRAPLRAVGPSWISLLASLIAFVYCAVPATLLAINPELPNTMLTHNALLPFAVSHQHVIFAIAATLLLLAAWTTWHNDAHRRLIEPQEMREHRRLRHWNRWIVKISAGLWLAGMIAAYVVPPAQAALG